MSSRALGEEDEAEAALRYQRGASTRELATRFDTSEAAIRRALERKGVARRPIGYHGHADVATAEIVRLRDREGMSWEQVAAATGMRPGGVRRRYDTHMRRASRE